MDNFCGTWKQETKSENIEAFLDAAGITGKEKDDMVKLLSKFEYIKKGDNQFQFIHSSDDPPLTKSYDVTFGETVESTDIFGRKFKSTLNLVNPNLITETCIEWIEDPLDVAYEIKGGDTLEWRTRYNDITTTMILKKVSS